MKMKSIVLFVLIVAFYVVVTESYSTAKPITIKAGTTLKPVTVKATTISTTTPKSTTKTTLKTSTTIKTTTSPITTTATKSTSRTTIKQAVKTTTTAKPLIKSLAVCKDTNSSALNGILYPVFTVNATNAYTRQTCRFDIFAPSNYQIQIICPYSNVTLYRSSLNIDGVVDNDYFSPVPITTNRTYYSIGNSSYLSVKFGITETFNCQWTTVPVVNTTDYKICQQLIMTEPKGTIRSTPSDGGPARSCSFYIRPIANVQTQISCSVVNLASIASSILFLSGVNDDHYTLIYGQISPPVLNRIYYSSSNSASVGSSLGIIDEFACNWTTTPWNMTTDFKMCRHGMTSSPNGTIQPFLTGMANGQPPRNCSFIIRAPSSIRDQIEISCSAVNLSSSSSEFFIFGIVEDAWPNRPVKNRIYYSSVGRDVTVTSKYEYSDSFNCKWNTTTNLVTTNFKICRDSEAKGVISGTFQSLDGIAASDPPRDCRFYVYAPAKKFVAIICSIVNLDTSSGSYFQILGNSDVIVADPPVANQAYTIPANVTDQTFYVNTRLGYGDNLDCKWTYN